MALTDLPADLQQAVSSLAMRAHDRQLLPLDTWCSARTLRSLAKKNALGETPVPAPQLAAWLARTPDRFVRNGNLVVFDHRAPHPGTADWPSAQPPMALYWYLEGGQWRLDPLTTTAYTEADPGPQHPENRSVSLAEATAGIEGQGPLRVDIATSHGTLHCTLAEAEAPRTVANFVGLARGKRAFLDGARHDDPKAGTWRKRPFYDGLTFHRVIPEFMIQGGDPQGDGEGGPGYTLADELSPALRYEGGGVMGMANGGPNTNGSQFFVTEQTTAWLTDRYSIFGRCDDLDVVRAIARVAKRPDDPSMPLEPVRILGMRFHRGR